MTRYSVQPRYIIFVTGYGFLSFARNIRKNTGNNMIKSLSWKYSQKLLDHAKKSATDKLKMTSKKEIQKAAETTFDLIGNKIVNKIQKILQNSRQNNVGTLTNEAKNTWRKVYISREKRQNIIDDLRLI